MHGVARILPLTCFDARLALSPLPDSSLMPCMGGIISAWTPHVNDTGLTAFLPVPRRSAWEGVGWSGAKDQKDAWLNCLQRAKQMQGTAPFPAAAATNSTPLANPLTDVTNQT